MLTKNDVIVAAGVSTNVATACFIRVFKRKMIVIFSASLNEFSFSKEYIIKETFDDEYHEFLAEFKANYLVFLRASNKLKNKGFVEDVPNAT